MKRVLIIFFSILILCGSVFAVESDSDSLDYYGSDGVGGSSGSGGGSVITEYLYPELPDIYLMGSDIPVDATITDISVMSLAPITPSDASGLKAVLLEVIGDYDPVIIEYAYENYNGSTAYLREVQPDYVWQGSLLLFGLIIYCLFRLGGALIRD